MGSVASMLVISSPCQAPSGRVQRWSQGRFWSITIYSLSEGMERDFEDEGGVKESLVGVELSFLTNNHQGRVKIFSGRDANAS